jgi:hypothetical protein
LFFNEAIEKVGTTAGELLAEIRGREFLSVAVVAGASRILEHAKALKPYTFGKSDQTDMFREDGRFKLPYSRLLATLP